MFFSLFLKLAIKKPSILKTKKGVKLFKKSQKNFLNKEAGISIIGVLIAIIIIGVTLTAGLSFMSNATRMSSVSRHQITANFLAEEGMELIKNAKNTGDLNNKDGFSALKSLVGNKLNPDYKLATGGKDGNTIFSSIPKTKPNLKKVNNFYEADNDSTQFFSRSVEIKAGAGTCANGVLVVSTVEWRENWEKGSSPHKAVVEGCIYDWWML